MSAKVIPIRQTCRVHFIDRLSRRAAELNEHAGERFIQQQLQLQREAMRRKSIADDLIEAELRCLESAIRAKLWRMILMPGGAA